MNHFLRNLVLGERMFPRFNIDPIPSLQGYEITCERKRQDLHLVEGRM